MSRLTDRIYHMSPLWMQRLGINVYGLLWKHRRFGGAFSRYVDQFIARERFTDEQWVDFQSNQLRNLLISSYEYVPHYREQIRNIGLSVPDLMHFSTKDLPILPLLEKEDLRKEPEYFLSSRYSPRELNTYHTGGTTGTPLEVKMTTDVDRMIQAAYEVRVRRWAGVDNTMSRAMIGGRLIVSKDKNAPPFWRYNIIEKQLYLSAFHISKQNISDYVSAINYYKPDYIVGYSSALFFLSRLIIEEKYSIRYQPKAILTSSERLTLEMREMLETAFRCKVFDAYSGVEGCCLASECEYHKMHISPDVGIVELINKKGEPAKPGELAEIVATGLLNFAQPLIRYRTRDLCVLKEEKCLCGRNMPIIDGIEGRLEDTLIGPDGSEMISHGFLGGIEHIRESQIIQYTPFQFTIKVVVDQEFNNLDREAIRRKFFERLGNVAVTIEIVDSIEKTMGGKFRAVISYVGRN